VSAINYSVMARTKQVGGKRVGAKKTARKASAGKALRKSYSGKGVVVPTQKRKYRKRPGSKLISRKINTFANWIYS
jgi:hypothetical protein